METDILQKIDALSQKPQWRNSIEQVQKAGSKANICELH